MSDYSRTVMRQYANSPALIALLDYFDQWVDLTAFSDAFLSDIWDIDTARGFGLDIWGRILGQTRYIQVLQSPGGFFGFDIRDAVGSQWQPFNQAPFWDGSPFAVTAVPLGDADYRKLLLVKAAANIARSDCDSINTIMRAMFGDRGRCYVGYSLDRPMNIGYHFEFFPTAVERSIIESGIFPRPAGTTVRYIYQQFDYSPFGFAGMNSGANPEYVSGFDQGPFYNNP